MALLLKTKSNRETNGVLRGGRIVYGLWPPSMTISPTQKPNNEDSMTPYDGYQTTPCRVDICDGREITRPVDVAVHETHYVTHSLIVVIYGRELSFGGFHHGCVVLW